MDKNSTVEMVERYNTLTASMQGIEAFSKENIMHTEMARDYDKLVKERDELWIKMQSNDRIE
jgi:hypothetical protein